MSNKEDVDKFSTDFVLLGEDGERLLYTGIEDYYYHLLSFKTRMRVEGHEAIIADNDDFMPVRPDDAYHRQNGDWGYGGEMTDSDRKQIYMYKSDMLRINKSAAYVIWA